MSLMKSSAHMVDMKGQSEGVVCMELDVSLTQYPFLRMGQQLPSRTVESLESGMFWRASGLLPVPDMQMRTLGLGRR